MKSLVLGLFLLVSTALFSQNNPVKITVNTPLSNQSCEKDEELRTVTLARADGSSPIIFNVLGCKIERELNLEPGNYVIDVTALDSPIQSQKFTVKAGDTNITLPDLKLETKTQQLAEVTITARQKKFIKIDPDKTTVNVKDNGMLNSGNAMDAVRRIPGVVKSPGGGLTLNGRGVQIYIDGAPSTLTGQDLENYLNSLPAGAIEKIELIYNPGAAFDANASGSIINIVTASRKMKGVNASFNVNYNFNEYQKPSPQILLNGKVNEVSWQTMFGVNYIEGENQNNSTQTFTTLTPPVTLDQKNFTQTINRNLYWRTGLNYRINDKSNLLFNYNMSASNDDNYNTNTATGNGINFLNRGLTEEKTNFHEASAQYKRKLDTIGSTVDVIAYGNYFGRTPVNQSVSEEAATRTFNNSDLNFDLYNYYLKYDFNLPITKLKLNFATGGKFNHLKVTNFGQYNFESPNEDVFDNGTFSDVIDFNYLETNLAFYAQVTKSIKKFSFTAGLRFEDFNVTRNASTVANEIKFTNTNLFPSVSLNYRFTDQINLNSTYNRKVNQPGYTNIDPNNNSLFNRYNASEGNLLLAPVFFDNFSATISAFDYIQLGVNYSVSKDANQFVIAAEPGELVANRTFVQIDRFKTFSSYINFPIPLDYIFKGKNEFNARMANPDKMNYIYANIAYQKTTTDGFSTGFKNDGVFTYGGQAQIQLPYNIVSTLNYFYVPTGIWEIYKVTEPIQQFDISLNRDFMNKRLKLGVHCFDLFNINKTTALIPGENIRSTFYEKRDSRVFRISLTYNFGNLKLQKENTDINTDKINTGGGLLK